MFFEPELPAITASPAHSSFGSPANGLSPNLSEERTKSGDHSVNKTASNNDNNSCSCSTNGNMAINASGPTGHGSSVLDLQGDNYFSCAVGRKRSTARYLLNSSVDVVALLKKLAD